MKTKLFNSHLYSPRTRKLLCAFGGIFALLWIVYLAGANIFLQQRRLQEIVNSRPEKLFVDYKKAWTLVPGLVHLEGFVIRGHDGRETWSAEIPRVRVLVGLFHLPFRTLRTYAVRGTGGFFRIQRGERLPELPQKPSSRGPFFFDLSGIALDDFEEITVFDYSYKGPAFVGGAFELLPGRRLEISRAEVELAGGFVFLGDHTLSSSLTGTIEADLPEWLPGEEEPAVIVDRTSAEIQLKGALERADFLNHYVDSIPWLKLSDVSGDFRIDANVDSGAFVAPSSARITAKKMGAGMGNYRAYGAGSAEWMLDDRGEDPLMRMRLELHKYEASEIESKQSFARGKGLRVIADSYDLSLRKMFSDLSDLSASIIVDNVEVTDLRFLNAFIPIANHFEILEGTAHLDARLNVSTRRAAEAGFCRVEALGAKARFRKTSLSGDFAVTAIVEDVAEGAGSFRVSGTRVAATSVRVVEDKKKGRPPWAGELSLLEGWVEPEKSVVFHGSAELRLDDARPVLSVLSHTSRIARIVARFADMKNLKGSSNFRIGDDLVEFTGLDLRSSDVDLKANLRLADDKAKTLALLRFGILEAALWSDGKDTQTKIIKARDWYERRLPWKP